MATPRPFYVRLNLKVRTIQYLLMQRATPHRLSSGSAEAYSLIYGHIHSRQLLNGEVPDPTPATSQH